MSLHRNQLPTFGAVGEQTRPTAFARVLRPSRSEPPGLTIRRAEVRKRVISIGLSRHMLDMIP